MHSFLRTLHTFYILLWFVISFLVLFPFFLLFSLTPSWHHWAYKLDHLWALFYFRVSLFSTQVEFESVPPGSGPVIYCANHFSTMDIPSMALLPKQACYVGKESIKKLPLFGYMFKTLHITVNRSSLKDRGRAFQKYKEALNQGKSLFIFPEGGIVSTHFPYQAKYKDGPFKVAIEQQVPIVPVTIAYNWKVLPDGDWLIKSLKIKLIVHTPMPTNGLQANDVPVLKEKVFATIQNRLLLENSLTDTK